MALEILLVAQDVGERDASVAARLGVRDRPVLEQSHRGGSTYTKKIGNLASRQLGALGGDNHSVALRQGGNSLHQHPTNIRG